MSQIVKEGRRQNGKLKRPKAAGESENSERGMPIKTFSDAMPAAAGVSIRSRQHQRRSSDIAEDHGFSPPKENDGMDSRVKSMEAPSPQRASRKLRIQRVMDLTTTSSILCMSVIGVKQDGFLALMPTKWNAEVMLATMYKLGDLTEKHDALTNAIALNFEHSNEGFMAALCALKTTNIKDACELVVTLFDRDFDGKVTKKDLYYHFNAAIPTDTKDIDQEFLRSKERAKQIFKAFDVGGKGFFDKKDVMAGLKADPRNVGLLSPNLVRDKKWQRTSICACRGSKEKSLLSWMKNRKRELRKKKKAVKEQQQNSDNKKSAFNQENNEVSKQLEERRKAREKQREEMRMRIQNQKLNLKAQKKYSKNLEKGFSLVLKEEQGATVKESAPSMSAIKSNLPQMEEDEEDEIVDEICEEESDQADDGVEEDDFLDESITEDILAGSGGSLTYSQQFS